MTKQEYQKKKDELDAAIAPLEKAAARLKELKREREALEAAWQEIQNIP